MSRAFDAVVDTLYGETMQQKVAQGAAEIGHALNSGSNAYVPYGYGQNPLEVEGPQQSYTDAVREAATQNPPEPDRDMGR
ncbi:MAG: hypothetical protein ACYC3I_08000 [Gemmataceae bacterium]